MTTRLRISLVTASVALLTGACAAASHPATLAPRTAAGHDEAAAAERVQARRAAESGDFDRADQHAAAADAQFAAANELYEREITACTGISPENAAVFGLDRGVVRAVNPVGERWGGRPPSANGRGYLPQRLVGAVLEVYSDLPPEQVYAILRCRAARARSRGDDGSDPFAVRGASWKVRGAPNGAVSIEVRAPDEASASEVLRRAQALLAR